MTYPYSMPMRDYLKGPEGNVAIEIECEFERMLDFHDLDNPPGWRIVGENSLRNGLEFVSRNPVKSTYIPTHLGRWEGRINEYGTPVEKSPRTSIHVHVNVLNGTVMDSLNAVTSYYLAETALLGMCGESRKGNLFCLSLADAPYSVHTMTKSMLKGGWPYGALRQEEAKYGSLNLASIPNRGSMEFRAMEGTLDTKRIGEWATNLCSLVDMSKKFKAPKEIITYVFDNSPEALLKHLFKKDFVKKLTDVPGWQDGMAEAIELLYNFAYNKKIWETKKKKGMKKTGFLNLEGNRWPEWANTRLRAAPPAPEPVPDQAARGRVQDTAELLRQMEEIRRRRDEAQVVNQRFEGQRAEFVWHDTATTDDTIT